MIHSNSRRANIFEQSLPITGTIAERYLQQTRGIENIQVDHDHIRYQPKIYDASCKRYYSEGIVFAGRDKNNQVQTIQTVYLNSNAQKMNIKVPKRTIGPYNNAFVMAQQGDNKHIAIAEGPETALSVAAANPKLTVYIALGVSNLGKVPINKDTKKVYICADNDGKDADSNTQVNKAINLLLEQDVAVYLARPKQSGHDFNDVLIQHGKDEIKHCIENAEHITSLREIAPNSSLAKATKDQSIDKLYQQYQQLEKTVSKLLDKCIASNDFAAQQQNRHKTHNKLNQLAASIKQHPEFNKLADKLNKNQINTIKQRDNEHKKPANITNAIDTYMKLQKQATDFICRGLARSDDAKQNENTLQKLAYDILKNPATDRLLKNLPENKHERFYDRAEKHERTLHKQHKSLGVEFKREIQHARQQSLAQSIEGYEL